MGLPKCRNYLKQTCYISFSSADELERQMHSAAQKASQNQIHCHQTEPQSTTCARIIGGEAGEQKEDAVKLVVCIGWG